MSITDTPPVIPGREGGLAARRKQPLTMAQLRRLARGDHPERRYKSPSAPDRSGKQPPFVAQINAEAHPGRYS